MLRKRPVVLVVEDLGPDGPGPPSGRFERWLSG